MAKQPSTNKQQSGDADNKANATEQKASKSNPATAESAKAVSNSKVTNAAEPQTEPKDDGPAIIVIAQHDRRRGGISFPDGQEVRLTEADITEEQFEAINNDPVLKVKQEV